MNGMSQEEQFKIGKRILVVSHLLGKWDTGPLALAAHSCDIW